MQTTGNGKVDHPVSLGSTEESERHRLAGNTAMKGKQFKAAEQFYGMALGTAANVEQYGLGYLNRAAARLRMADYEGAEVDAQRAVNMMDENPKGWFRLGEAQRSMGKYSEAVKSYREAACRAPEDAMIQEALKECSINEAKKEILEAQEERIMGGVTEKKKPEARRKLESEVDVMRRKLAEMEANLHNMEEDPEVVYLSGEDEVTQWYEYKRDEGVEKRWEEMCRKKKKTVDLTANYDKFQKINDDLSDEENEAEKTERMVQESAPCSVLTRAGEIFDHFDNDKDGYWNFSEAAAATQSLENRALSHGDYLARCEDHKSRSEVGWSKPSVTTMYALNAETQQGLSSHYAVLQSILRKQHGIDLRTYYANDAVQGYLEGVWKDGVVHSESTDDAGTYNVIWENGEGTLAVPASCLRPRDVGYTVPSSMFRESKKMTTATRIDAATGLASSSAPSSSLEIGSRILDDVPQRPSLPEEPVQRLIATTEMSGFADPTTGLPSKQKIKKLLGHR